MLLFCQPIADHVDHRIRTTITRATLHATLRATPRATIHATPHAASRVMRSTFIIWFWNVELTRFEFVERISPYK